MTSARVRTINSLWFVIIIIIIIITIIIIVINTN